MHWSPYWPTPASRASPSSPGAYSRVRTASHERPERARWRPKLGWRGFISPRSAWWFCSGDAAPRAVAPTHDTAALDHAFRAAVVTPGAGAAFAAPLRDAVIASSSAAAALAGSGLAVWLCARVDADAARESCSCTCHLGGMRCCSCRLPFSRLCRWYYLSVTSCSRTARGQPPRTRTRVVRSSTRAPRRARCGCTVCCAIRSFMRAKMRTGPRERSLLMHTRRSPMLQRGSASFTSTRISASLLRRSLRAQSHVTPRR